MSPRQLVVGILLGIVLAGCAHQAPSASQRSVPPEALGQAELATQTTNEGTVRIATFNIQNLGPTKAARPEVMAVLAGIIRRYDIVAVQEVSDVSGRAPRALLEAVNQGGSSYGLLLSERTGKQPSDRTSQEAYAFYYRTSLITARDQGMIYPDDANDYFQREPFVAGFSAGNQRFVLITIHTRPESAVEEIGALTHVINWARSRYTGEDSFVTLGDFNGSGSYARPADLVRLRAQLPFLWVVPDDADTNVSTTTSLAYDRIIITDGLRPSYRSAWGVDRAFTTSTVSDHWPVWFELSLGQSN